MAGFQLSTEGWRRHSPDSFLTRSNGVVVEGRLVGGEAVDVESRGS
jgi:hypothetical protein